MLIGILQDMGLEPSQYDPYLITCITKEIYNNSSHKLINIEIYVDDFFSSNPPLRRNALKILSLTVSPLTSWERRIYSLVRFLNGQGRHAESSLSSSTKKISINTSFFAQHQRCNQHTFMTPYCYGLPITSIPMPEKENPDQN